MDNQKYHADVYVRVIFFTYISGGPTIQLWDCLPGVYSNNIIIHRYLKTSFINLILLFYTNSLEPTIIWQEMAQLENDQLLSSIKYTIYYINPLKTSEYF